MSWSALSCARPRSWGARLAPLASPVRSCLGGVRPRPIVDMSYSRHFLDFQGSSIPTCMKKLVVTKLSANFREAVALHHDVPVPLPGDGDLLVRNRFVGVNASDINYSAGRYDPTVKPPFDTGFEGIGEIVALGLSASAKYTVGQAVAYMRYGAFAEYIIVPSKEAIPVPSVKPEFLTLLVCPAASEAECMQCE